MGHDTDTVADEGLCGEADPAVVEAATIAGLKSVSVPPVTF